jgi:hypothetical protein
MNGFFQAFVYIELILLFTLIVFAIFVYRSNRSTPFRLLVLAAVCYFIRRFIPFATGLALGCTTKTSHSFHAWVHTQWWFGLTKSLDLLFLILFVASFLSFYRSTKERY